MSFAGFASDASQGGQDSISPEEQAKKDAYALAMKWRRRIKTAEKHFDRVWFPQCKKIVARYRDERSSEGGRRARRFNLLWSNVQTLGPAVYARQPKPEVGRRYHDADPVSRVASMVLERGLEYELDTSDFSAVMVQCRDDYLLCGRGTQWHRYEPEIETVTGEPDPETNEPTEFERVIGEKTCVDYVHWRDFLHSLAPTWQQVTWVGRRVLMGRDRVEKRFGPDVAGRLQYIHRQTVDTEEGGRKQERNQDVDLALIWEVWDKDEKQAVWISFDVDEAPLDVREDPLKLRGFFPCPKPLYATLTNDRLDPVPDYTLYQDQASEIDTLTQRIALLQKALALRGVYDGQNPNIVNLLSDRPENTLLPVDNWAAFAEKGGMKGQVSFLPIEEIAGVLTQLQQQRGAYKQDIYEITGISDIIRGVSQAEETATAQQIKGNYAGLRLGDRRKAVSEFVRDGLRIKAEIICEQFEPQTLREMSGFDQMTEVQALAKVDPQKVELLWQQVVTLLQTDKMRTFRIDVETDSLIEADQQEEQASRMQFLEAAGGFINNSLPVVQAAPQMGPLIGQMLMFGVRGFRIGRELESAFEEAMATLQQAPAQPQQGQDQNPPEDKSQPSADAMLRAKAEEDRTNLNAQTATEDAMMKRVNAALDKYKADQDFRIAYDKLMLEYGVHPAQKSGAVPTILPAAAAAQTKQ